MRVLFVGDVHGKLDDLDDCFKLRALILDTVSHEKPDLIVFLGDQYHTHAIVNVAVQKFWLETFAMLPAERTVALVGNHDKPGDRTATADAMQVHDSQCMVVREPTVVGGLLFMSYCHDPQTLVQASDQHPECRTLVCHQTFDGAKYDNGFYAKEALSPLLLKQAHVISGHVHTPMEFGNVWYPGSPRWQTLSDANISRAIELQGFDDVGNPIGERKSISTDLHLRKFWQLVDSHPATVGEESVESLVEKHVKEGDKVVINLQGPMAWCNERKGVLNSLRPGIRFRLFPSDQASAKVRESDGMALAFKKHFDAFRPKNGTARDVLERLVQERACVS